MNRTASRKLRLGVAVVLLVAVVGGYLAFADQEQEPVEISKAEELQQIRNDLDGNYVLVDDIDLSHIDDFNPIGGYGGDFTGTLDGNGHTISNLTIDRPGGANDGLFFGMTGTVENLTLRDVDVTGGEGVGGLAGVSGGTITDSRVTGEVNGDKSVGGLVGVAWAGEIRNSSSEANVTGNLMVGGLVGNNDRGTVTRSSATGSVSGGTGIGGLVGRNEQVVDESHAGGDVTGNTSGGLVGANENEIRNSYATANVTGIAGGLVGVNTGEVRNSYATGNARGTMVGGLIVWNEGEVRNSYAAGKVAGDESVGGLIENGTGDMVINSYWDINTTGQNKSDGGKGLTTAEMTGSAARKNMEGIDFGETWRTAEDYPRLAWQDVENSSFSPDIPRKDNSTSRTQAESEDSTSNDLVSFSGLIFKNRTVRSLDWFYLENRTDTTNPDGDDFTVQGIDTDGNVISSQSFDAPFRAYVSPSEESPIDTNVTGFVLKEKYPYDLAKFRLVENGTTIAEFDANVGLLRTAVGSVHRNGFEQQDIAEQRRKTLLNEIEEIENMLNAGNTQAAVRKMENDLKPSLDRWLEDGYETVSALQMTKKEVLTTTEAVTERLRAQR